MSRPQLEFNPPFIPITQCMKKFQNRDCSASSSGRYIRGASRLELIDRPLETFPGQSARQCPPEALDVTDPLDHGVPWLPAICRAPQTIFDVRETAIRLLFLCSNTCVGSVRVAAVGNTLSRSAEKSMRALSSVQDRIIRSRCRPVPDRSSVLELRQPVSVGSRASMLALAVASVGTIAA
jgi:hypothetical protein